MESIKKFAKEISIFGLVLVIFIGLFIFRNLTHEDVTAISQAGVTNKMEAGDSFALFVGDNSDANVYGYITEVVEPFLQDHSGTQIYFLDTQDMEDSATWIKETFSTTNGSQPQYFVIQDGAVDRTYAGTVSYIRLNQLFD